MRYTTFSDLTVSQYQELYQINSSDSDEIEKAIGSVSVLTGLPRWDVEELPLPDFNKAASELAIIFSPKLEPGKPQVKISDTYTIQLNPRKLTAGQYIDVQTFLKDKDWIKNMDKIIASLSVNKKGKYEAKNHEQISEQVREMKFLDIHSTCVFFLSLWKVSMQATETYLKKQLKKKLTKEQYSQLEQMDLAKVMDGSLMQ